MDDCSWQMFAHIQVAGFFLDATQVSLSVASAINLGART